MKMNRLQPANHDHHPHRFSASTPSNHQELTRATTRIYTHNIQQLRLSKWIVAVVVPRPLVRSRGSYQKIIKSSNPPPTNSKYDLLLRVRNLVTRGQGVLTLSFASVCYCTERRMIALTHLDVASPYYSIWLIFHYCSYQL